MAQLQNRDRKGKYFSIVGAEPVLHTILGSNPTGGCQPVEIFPLGGYNFALAKPPAIGMLLKE
jgi:hypothetical protein